MTQLLEKAINTVKNLPEDRQESIAALILEELDDQQLWDEQFAKTKDKLSIAAKKVREDIKKGRVQKKDTAN